MKVKVDMTVAAKVLQLTADERYLMGLRQALTRKLGDVRRRRFAMLDLLNEVAPAGNGGLAETDLRNFNRKLIRTTAPVKRKSTKRRTKKGGVQ